jgi:hypothetical protein
VRHKIVPAGTSSSKWNMTLKPPISKGGTLAIQVAVRFTIAQVPKLIASQESKSKPSSSSITALQLPPVLSPKLRP